MNHWVRIVGCLLLYALALAGCYGLFRIKQRSSEVLFVRAPYRAAYMLIAVLITGSVWVFWGSVLKSYDFNTSRFALVFASSLWPMGVLYVLRKRRGRNK